MLSLQNDICAGNNNRNGTCYTAEECEDRGGTSSGSCADGFGVCCISKILLLAFQLAIYRPLSYVSPVSLECGKTSSENCTYLVQASTTSPQQSCTYTLCPASDNVCRMRLDFTVCYRIMSGQCLAVGTLVPDSKPVLSWVEGAR